MTTTTTIKTLTLGGLALAIALALAGATAVGFGGAGGGAAIAAEPLKDVNSDATYYIPFTARTPDGQIIRVCFSLQQGVDERHSDVGTWEILPADRSNCRDAEPDPTPTPTPVAALDTTPRLTGWTQRTTRHHTPNGVIIGYEHTAYCWDGEPCPTYAND